MGNLILSQISEVGGEKQGNFYKRLYKNTKQKTFPRGKVFYPSGSSRYCCGGMPTFSVNALTKLDELP